jgi:hypothetical protein
MVMKERSKTLLILAVLLACSLLLPVFATKPFSQQDSSLVIKEVLMKTSVAYLWLSPIIHVLTLILIVALYLYGSRAGRFADGFFAILILFIAFSNHIAVTDTYGVAIVTGNLVPILIVGLFWVWEVYRPKNDYVLERLPAWRYWVLPFAFLAFWSPIDAQLNPDFNPLFLLNSSFGVMYCPTTPVIIALLTLTYPRVNRLVLTATSFVGLIMGLFNALSYFIMPGYTLWNLVLHTPLIFISLYGLLIPILAKNNMSQQRRQEKETI